MYLLILYFPLIGSIGAILANRYFGKGGSCVISIYCMMCTVLSTLYVCYDLFTENTICVIRLFKWIDVGIFTLY